jgi:NDP-hexose-3-ketoreductase
MDAKLTLKLNHTVIEKAKEYASTFNIKAYVGYENLLNENIDAIYIPLPTGLHKKWVNESLMKGIHVYAEKSLSFSILFLSI